MKITKLTAGIGGVVTVMGLAFTPLTSIAAPVFGTTVTPKPNKPTSNQKSTAGFEVLPGTLSLNQVPTLKFGGATVAEIVRGTTLKTPDVSNGLQVTDYQGTHEGWQLMVGLSHFENGSKRQSGNLALGLSKKQTDNLQTAGPVETVSLTSQEAKGGVITNPKPVWTAKRQTGQGINYADVVASGTSLKLTNPMVSKGAYSASLFWTLQAGPEAAAAD